MIQTSDFDQRGLEAPLVLAVLEADVSPLNSEDDDLTADPATVVMGELVVADATAPNGRLVIAQVERHNDGAAIRLRRTADDAHFSVYFDNEGSPVYPTAKLFVQIAAEGPRIAYSIGRTGGGYNNWTLDEAAQAAAVDGIGTGDRFLLAIAVPAVQTTGTATGRHASRGSTAGTAGALPQITTAAAGRHATRGSAAGTAGVLPQTTTAVTGRHATRGLATGIATAPPPEVAIDTPAQRVDGGAVLQLAVTGAAAIVSYAWTADPEVGAFSDPTADKPAWTAPASGQVEQTVTVAVTVTDDLGATAVASVVITIRPDEIPAGAWVRTVEGDVLDELCWRHYGHEGAVPAVLDANPGLAALGPVLPPGRIVALPDLPEPARRTTSVRLWEAPRDA